MKIQATVFAALAATVVAFGAAGSAEARPGWNGPGQRHAVASVNRRIANQNRRIRRATRQGRLTRREARSVGMHLRRIRGLRFRYFRDRHLSRYERRRLTGLLNRNSRRIQRLASNRRVAPRYRRLSRYNGF